MKKAVESDKSPIISVPSTSKFAIEKCWSLVWKCMTTIIVFCVLIMCFAIIMSRNVETNDSTFFILKYQTNMINGSSLGLIDLHLLNNDLMKQWQLSQVTIYNAQFISSLKDNHVRVQQTTQTNNIQYKTDTFIVSLSIQNPVDCTSIDCRNNFLLQINNSIANSNEHMHLPVTFINGRITNVQLRFLSNQQLAKDTINEINQLIHDDSTNEQNNPKYKREVSDSTSTSNSGSLFNIPTPIFFPKFMGNFQLALKSNTSLVVVIGNDYNIYLSAQYLSKTEPSTFALYDLQVSNQSAVALIQDAVNHRYLHTYNEIQTNGYSRLRTHLDTYMPCGSNIMFWVFQKGYLQFYRGGQWAYDTAACLDPVTGLVKIWIINGQQGLTALNAKYQTCGLAPLIPINYI